jgi:hypothetical protein
MAALALLIKYQEVQSTRVHLIIQDCYYPMARAEEEEARLQPQLTEDTVEDLTPHLAQLAAHLMVVMEPIILPDLIHRQRQATERPVAVRAYHRLRMQDLVQVAWDNIPITHPELQDLN